MQGLIAAHAHQWQLPAVTQSGSLENGSQITVKSDKSIYLPAEPIVMTIFIKNVSREDQLWFKTGPDSDFEFLVSSHGTETTRTKYGAQSYQRWIDLYKPEPVESWSGPAYTLHAGQGETFRVVVNRLRDMTLDGSYTIIVKLKTDTSSQLVADPVQVEVVTPLAGAQ